MIKFVIDVERGIAAFGGEFYKDADALLLESGSVQEYLWGGNLHPWAVPPLIVFSSLINIRPAAGNGSMIVENPELRERLKSVMHRWIQLEW